MVRSELPDHVHHDGVCLEVGRHHVDMAFTILEMDDGDIVLLSEISSALQKRAEVAR
jgi:hypothetical protein